MKQTLDRDVLIGLGLVAALLVVIPVLNHRNTNQLNEDAGWVAHTHEVLGMTADVLLSLVDAETGERGFIITGKDDFLQPYNTSLARLDERLAKLKEQTKDNPRQQENIRKLVAMTTNRLALLEEGIALRRKGVQEAQAFIAAKKGKEQMDAIREPVGEMKRDETDLLKERQGLSSLAYQTALTTGLLSALLSLGLFGVFVWLLRRSLMARQNAAAILYEQREWFHTTLASIGDAVIATDIEGHVAFLNSVGESLTGWKEEDAKDQPLEVVFRIVNEDTRQPVENPALRALKQGQIVGLANHTVLIARDGTERAIDDSAAPIRNAAGTITGSVLVFRDISSRRLEELARQERERFIPHILDASPGVVYIYDLEERRTVFINQRVEPTLGVTADQVMEAGERFMAERIHPDDMPRLQDHLQGFATVTNGEVVATEYRMRHSAGKWHWFASRDVVFTRTLEGKPKQVLGVAMDMSDRKQLEEDIRRQHDVLTMAEAAARIGHFEWSIPDDESWWSPEMEALYGLPPGGYERGNAGWRKMVDPGDVARAEEDVRESLTTGRLQTEFRVVWSNGTIRWLEARAVVSRDSDGKPVRMVGINMDITERKQAEEALRDADRRKDEFLATLAHEMRNPLAPLRNGLQVIKLARGDGEAIEQTRAMMERQVGQMARLIDDLMDLSRIRQGKVELRKERVELGAALNNAVETSRPLIETRGHQLTITVPTDPIYVDGDVTRLAQVFTNLLNNAAKYTEEGGRVTLKVERQGSDAVVSVRDSGVGIPPHMLPRIFDMFTQVDGSLEKSQGGLGIGLSLVKSLVEMHGGGVEARSDGHGTGSEFFVRLPVVLCSTREKRDNNAGEVIKDAARHRNLIVDVNQESARNLLLDS